MVNIDIEYATDKTSKIHPYRAYARNSKTGKLFLLGSYSTAEKRDLLAIKVLDRKIRYSSKAFKIFVK